MSAEGLCPRVELAILAFSSWYLPQHPFLQSHQLSFLSSLPCHLLPCEEAGAVARWMEACETGSLLGAFWEIWPLAGAHGAGSTVGPRVNLSCTSLNQYLYLLNRE